METDKSLYNISVAAVKRSSLDPEIWLYSKLLSDKTVDGFDLNEGELPIFIIVSEAAKTLVTTRRIVEISCIERKEISITDIDDIIYGSFKGRPNKPSLSIFRTIDLYGDQLNFQLETGGAAIGLRYSIDALRMLSDESF